MFACVCFLRIEDRTRHHPEPYLEGTEWWSQRGVLYVGDLWHRRLCRPSGRKLAHCVHGPSFQGRIERVCSTVRHAYILYWFWWRVGGWLAEGGAVVLLVLIVVAASPGRYVTSSSVCVASLPSLLHFSHSVPLTLYSICLTCAECDQHHYETNTTPTLTTHLTFISGMWSET